MIKLYRTWEKVKDTFVKPSLRVYFGKWKNDPNLPVWRRGPSIWLIPRRYRYSNSSKAYTVKDTVMISTGEASYKYGDKEYKTKCYKWVPNHKLPGKLKAGDYVWNRKIRKKLKKWHLSWIPPIIQLPIWMSFHIYNWDLCWKSKFNSIRYEYPPQLTFVAFGWALSFTLHCPVKNDYSHDDTYWESILYYIFGSKKLIDTIGDVGIYTRFGDNVSYFGTRPTYIRDDRLEEYFAATSELKAKHPDKIIV